VPLRIALDDSAVFGGDAVKLVNQVVDGGVGGGDFALQAFELRRRELAGMLLLVQFQHPVHQRHGSVVDGLRKPALLSWTASLFLAFG